MHHPTTGDLLLQRLFHGFPDGRAGLGLVVLRFAVGLIVIIQGWIALSNLSDSSWTSFAGGCLALAIGVSVLAGFLTPILAALVSAGAVWILLGGAPLSSLASTLCAALLALSAAAIALLGPGAFSIDARLFGWREIIIPPSRFTE
jgi:hypothetical protein